MSYLKARNAKITNYNHSHSKSRANEHELHLTAPATSPSWLAQITQDIELK